MDKRTKNNQALSLSFYLHLLFHRKLCFDRSNWPLVSIGTTFDRTDSIPFLTNSFCSRLLQNHKATKTGSSVGFLILTAVEKVIILSKWYRDRQVHHGCKGWWPFHLPISLRAWNRLKDGHRKKSRHIGLLFFLEDLQIASHFLNRILILNFRLVGNLLFSNGQKCLLETQQRSASIFVRAMRRKAFGHFLLESFWDFSSFKKVSKFAVE